MSRRTAFTLIELLVVAGIFAMLFAMLLTGAKPGTSGQVRQAARQLASVLLAAQSRAIGSPLGAALILESGTASGLAATMSVTVANADMLPLITGSATGMPPASLTGTSASISIATGSLNADPSELADGYRIQFYERAAPAVQPPSPWFAFANPVASFRLDGGQVQQNTIWPAPVGGGAIDFRIARYPARAETAYDFPKTAAIDLRYSGVGDGATFSTTWSNLAGDGAIGIVFDSVGRIDALMQQVLSPSASRPQPVDPSSPIYLLVAARTDVDANTALASDQSLWVVIHHQTGRVSISSNVTQSTTDATALRAARAKARAQTAIGK